MAHVTSTEWEGHERFLLGSPVRFRGVPVRDLAMWQPTFHQTEPTGIVANLDWITQVQKAEHGKQSHELSLSRYPLVSGSQADLLIRKLQNKLTAKEGCCPTHGHLRLKQVEIRPSVQGGYQGASNPPVGHWVSNYLLCRTMWTCFRHDATWRMHELNTQWVVTLSYGTDTVFLPEDWDGQRAVLLNRWWRCKK